MLKKNAKFLYLKKVLRNLSLVVIPAAVIYFAFTVFAGNLAPGLPPLATMRTLDEIYTVITGTYDSSSVTPDADGSALEILKCITEKMNGGSC